jgi:TonB family protein
MITKNKKTSMNMLRKLSIVPVALIALYLFACNSRNQNNSDKVVAQEAKVETVEASSVKIVAQEGTVETLSYDLVDEKPMFNGKSAEVGFSDYLNNNIKYPVEAMENGIKGKVSVEFTIDTDGSVVDIKIVSSVDPLLDAEVLRVVKNSPKWTPGKQNGKPVRVTLTFPINFNLI